jgi:hypothetical protein
MGLAMILTCAIPGKESMAMKNDSAVNSGEHENQGEGDRESARRYNEVPRYSVNRNT